MEDIKFYEFLLKLSCYLGYTNTLADKFALQEKEISDYILNAKHTISQDDFDTIFVPLINKFEDRLVLMDEIRKANDDFEKTLHEYYKYFKGIIQ